MDSDFDELNDENVMLQEELLDILCKLDNDTCPPVSYAERRKVDAEKLRRDIYTTVQDLTNLRKHVNSETLTHEEQVIKDLKAHIRLQHRNRELIDKELNLLNAKLDQASDSDGCREELSMRMSREISSMKKEHRDLIKSLGEVESFIRDKHAKCVDLEHGKNRQSMGRSCDSFRKLKDCVRREVTTAETATSWSSVARRRRAMVSVAQN